MNVSTIPAATLAAPELAAPARGASPATATRDTSGGADGTRAHAARLLFAAGTSGPLPEYDRYALSFRVEKESNRIVVQVIDVETKQVLRSVPPEDVVDALKHASAVHGTLIDQQV